MNTTRKSVKIKELFDGYQIWIGKGSMDMVVS